MAQTKTETKTAMKSLGQFGIQYVVQDGQLLLAIPIDAKTAKAAGLSSTGKSKLVGSTGGFVNVPGTDPQVKLNLVASVPKD